jgi:hypothetical protein
VLRTLDEIVGDQEGVFAELIHAQREVERLNRAGQEMGLIDGERSALDDALDALQDAQHRFDALAAEALQSALNPPPHR